MECSLFLAQVEVNGGAVGGVLQLVGKERNHMSNANLVMSYS